MPKRKKTKGAQEPISRKTNGHDKALGERVNGRPKKGPVGLSHYDRNDRVIWQEMKAIKKWAKRNVKPNNK